MDKKKEAEKVEMVKQIIRQNDYRQNEKTHKQCITLGLSVNRPALDRFAEKLELIDKAERARALRIYQHPPADQQLRERSDVIAPQKAIAPYIAPSFEAGMSKVPIEDMTYEQVKKRETEITFELGALKIKESELLKELNSLSGRLKKSHRQ